ncbi:MAG TPA: hypothetical protein VN369_00285 [Terriglobales bacterium]|nr:hypothetical protein [Candidatus Acidoferrum sp.]HWQ50211.1 hypothetical protein [Terriglobales bacterium]
MAEYALGLDTSNYTTSVALCAAGGEYVSLRTPFDVAQGKRGVRQSDAVFLHTKELPNLLERIFESRPKIACVAVSDRPRDAAGSYMPCFMAGLAAARGLAAALDVPLFRLSHQRGHILAALKGAGREDLLGKAFHAYHVSGGTTELLHVAADGGITIAGATADLNAGQLIDRCGVVLGLKFPCGAALETLALNGAPGITPVRFKQADTVNLSGLENQFAAHLKAHSPEDCALWLLESVANALLALAAGVSGPLILAGGVMSNRLIKARLDAAFETYATDSEFAADNAVGVALYGAMQL